MTRRLRKHEEGIDWAVLAELSAELGAAWGPASLRGGVRRRFPQRASRSIVSGDMESGYRIWVEELAARLRAQDAAEKET